MKLYATTTSERASKGQGGNDFIEINIYDEEQDIIAIIGLKPKRFINDLHIVQIEYNGHFTKVNEHDMAEILSDFWGVRDKSKGEKKKGEDCDCAYHDKNGSCTNTPS